ncbi:Crp/Fnr family transcriptional regulator [Nocardia sp. NPDC050378]|uniref:Crp/Fnr family transcriptional regulator n=1 Tax=Nocardia sp. NPDC050378 TaxID=3155400 RepID=UPI0033EA75D4
MKDTIPAPPSASARTQPGRPPRQVGAGPQVTRLSPEAQAAWRTTRFAALPTAVSDVLLDHALESTVRAGEVFYRGSHHCETALLAMVVRGLLRFYLHVPDGRSVTVRYAGRGELIGVRGLALGGAAEPASRALGGALNGEALQDSRVLLLPRTEVARAARTRPALAWALMQEVAEQAMRDQELIATNVFSPVRARVARHLLPLAVRDGGHLVVAVSHQEIAAAIGSVREVVSRALCAFQDEGLLERRERRLVLLDPAGLHAAAIG